MFLGKGPGCSVCLGAPALYRCPGARRAWWGAPPCPPLAPGRIPAPAHCAWLGLQREEAARGRQSLSRHVCEVVRERGAVLICVFLHCSHLPLAISGLGRTPAESLSCSGPRSREGAERGRALPASAPGKSPAPARRCVRLACSSCSISSEGTFYFNSPAFFPLQCTEMWNLLSKNQHAAVLLFVSSRASAGQSFLLGTHNVDAFVTWAGRETRGRQLEAPLPSLEGRSRCPQLSRLLPSLCRCFFLRPLV